MRSRLVLLCCTALVVALTCSSPSQATHPRPKAATPDFFPIVPAYPPCDAPNRAHAPPLDYESCAPAAPISTHLAVGPRSVGNIRLRAVGGHVVDGNEGDMLIDGSISDVRCTGSSGGCDSSGSDYVGELQIRITVQITDHRSCGDCSMFNPIEAATGPEVVLDQASMACTTTADVAIGATCTANTSVKALLGSFPAPDGRRSLWELGAIQVLDGGSDGAASTAGNQLFETQGVFVP